MTLWCHSCFPLIAHFRPLIWKAQRETDWWIKKASLAQYFWMKTSWNVSRAACMVAMKMQNRNSDQWLAVDYVNSRFNIIYWLILRLRAQLANNTVWGQPPSLWLVHRTLNRTILSVRLYSTHGYEVGKATPFFFARCLYMLKLVVYALHLCPISF